MTKPRQWKRRRRPQEGRSAAEMGEGVAGHETGAVPADPISGDLGPDSGPLELSGDAPPIEPFIPGRVPPDVARRKRRRRKRRRRGGAATPVQAAPVAALAPETVVPGRPPRPPANGESAPVAQASPDDEPERPGNGARRRGKGRKKKLLPRRRQRVAVQVGLSDKRRPQKTKFSSNWWADRWIKMLESFGHSKRLPRGRYYARSGRVLDFRVGPGEVTAKVQGSRAQPYTVRIEVAPLDDRAWDRVTDAMASQALFAARLLSGEMPQNIGEVFASASVSLFPKMARDLKMVCSCPDNSNLCKHAVAVHYILAEAFDNDPFILLHLRGRSREEVIDSLTRARARIVAAESPALQGKRANGETEGEPVEDEGPPSPEPHLFYDLKERLDDVAFSLQYPAVSHAVLDNLGPPPTHNPEQARAVLTTCYALITQQAHEAAFGREAEPRRETPATDAPPHEAGRPSIVSKQVTLKSLRE